MSGRIELVEDGRFRAGEIEIRLESLITQNGENPLRQLPGRRPALPAPPCSRAAPRTPPVPQSKDRAASGRYPPAARRRAWWSDSALGWRYTEPRRPATPCPVR